MKNYEVSITAFTTIIIVNAESEEEAMNIAFNDVSTGDFELDECEVRREIKDGVELENAKRHANRVINQR